MHNVNTGEIISVYCLYYLYAIYGTKIGECTSGRRELIVRIQCKVKEGFIPSEKTVYIKSADGAVEEVTVSKDCLYAGRLEASEIGRKFNKVLVELPLESASGRWRIWVKPSQVGA